MHEQEVRGVTCAGPLTTTAAAFWFRRAPISRRQLETDWLEGGTRPRAGRAESLPCTALDGSRLWLDRPWEAGPVALGAASQADTAPNVLFGHAPTVTAARAQPAPHPLSTAPFLTVAARRARGVPLVLPPPPSPSVRRPHRRAPRPPSRLRAALRPAWPGARPSTARPLTDRLGRSVLPSTSPLGVRDAACTSGAIDGSSPTRWTDVGAHFVEAARRHLFPRSVELAPLAACDGSRHCR